jgi:hypothetical protein
MVNFVCDWGREHPRSASRRLGFAIDTNRDLCGKLLADPTCGSRYPQDPVHAHLPSDPPGRAACIVVAIFLEFGLLYAGVLCGRNLFLLNQRV